MGKRSDWSADHSATLEELIVEFDKAGVDKAAIVHSSTTYGFNNDYVVDAVALYPKRFTGVFSVNITQPDAPERMRYWVGKGLTGMRIFARGSTIKEAWLALDDPGTFPAWECAGELGISVATNQHATGPGLVQIKNILRRFPKVRVVIDHLGRPVLDDGPPYASADSLFALAIPAPSVDVDNRAAARSAVEHLLGLGHRRIACITNAPLAYTAAADRLAGYRDALDAAGIPADEGLVEEGAFDAGSGHAAMARLLARAGDVTACFIASDVVAFGALRAVREAGLRVPADVSVVGFDDIPLARHFDPPLTTVRLPAHALGAAAGHALIARLGGQPVVERTLLPTELIVRESTAARRHQTEGG